MEFLTVKQREKLIFTSVEAKKDITEFFEKLKKVDFDQSKFIDGVQAKQRLLALKHLYHKDAKNIDLAQQFILDNAREAKRVQAATGRRFNNSVFATIKKETFDDSCEGCTDEEKKAKTVGIAIPIVGGGTTATLAKHKEANETKARVASGDVFAKVSSQVEVTKTIDGNGNTTETRIDPDRTAAIKELLELKSQRAVTKKMKVSTNGNDGFYMSTLSHWYNILTNEVLEADNHTHGAKLVYQAIVQYNNEIEA